MRIFHAGSSLESVQSESHGPRQVVTSDKTTQKKYTNLVLKCEASQMLFHYFLFWFWKKSSNVAEQHIRIPAQK